MLGLKDRPRLDKGTSHTKAGRCEPATLAQSVGSMHQNHGPEGEGRAKGISAVVDRRPWEDKSSQTPPEARATGHLSQSIGPG